MADLYSTSTSRRMSVLPGGPFDLQDTSAYRRWREEKRRAYPQALEQVLVPIADGARLSALERRQINQGLRRANTVVFAFADAGVVDKHIIRNFGAALGLHRLDNNLCADGDGVSSLQVSELAARKGYIPYTDRRLSWHTDGYYNTAAQSINSIVMYCVRPAASGGESILLDHEMAYLLMRDEEPAWIDALMHHKVMTIPPNNEGGVTVRGARSGPVFSLRRDGGLHMRYTARTRSVDWAQSTAVDEAREFLRDVMREDSPYVLRHRLQAGQGILCANVLHARTAFFDDTQEGGRLLYRARYFDCIDTGGYEHNTCCY